MQTERIIMLDATTVADIATVIFQMQVKQLIIYIITYSQLHHCELNLIKD